MENYSFQYPSWFLILCAIGALCYAVFLYYRTNKFEGKTKYLKLILGLLRFSTIFLIGLLLLGPLFKSINEETKKPKVVILSDNSQSIGEWLTKSKITDYGQNISSLIDQFSEIFEVDLYSFDEKINNLTSIDSLDYQGTISNLSQAIQYISDIYEGENLGAVILATDAIYNDGKSPLYTKFNHSSPLYSIALGDTTTQNDLILKRVLHNEIGYLNDQLIIQTDIQAFDCSAKRARLTVQKKQGNTYTNIYTKELNINSNDFFTTEEITISLDKVGINQYRFSLTPLSTESNLQNNVKNIFIDVLDARKEIVIVANAPHPDLAVIKELLNQNKNYTVSIDFDSPDATKLIKADLVIFHNLPSERLKINGMVRAMEQRKTPRMYILGSQTDILQFNSLQEIVSIKSQPGITNEVQASINEDFNNFIVSTELQQRIEKYPPLIAPFGEYSFALSAQTLLNQKIGNISTDFPLLTFSDYNGIKTSYLFGEGLWKWKYYDYAEDSNFDKISELVDQSIVYTSNKADKRKFRASSAENVYYENEDIIFSAELYNDNYELINEKDVILNIRNDVGNEFTYTFSTNDRAYSLNAGKLLPGDYQYTATTNFNGINYDASGKFSVIKIEFELFDLEANHNLLQSISQKHGGFVFYPQETNRLADAVLSNDQLKPVIYQNTTTQPFLDLKWIFALLAALLGAEWFLRRYFGSV